ncbi:hypothetical protein SAMN05421636_106215 [Pricia antarctica]|uniref:Uncharacterized protein n=1 Tax=Pricia antarctica TaxID=641691 RepID=A0A1G7EJY5_9FLAO|nr:hypothetical protein [Pricia antarctica]SDE63726.1 hypothetical protein SAMN05421636_106215 [Pricia antarctica]
MISNCTLGIFLLVTQYALCQTIVSGTVNDTSGIPISGVNV